MSGEVSVSFVTFKRELFAGYVRSMDSCELARQYVGLDACFDALSDQEVCSFLDDALEYFHSCIRHEICRRFVYMNRRPDGSL